MLAFDQRTKVLRVALPHIRVNIYARSFWSLIYCTLIFYSEENICQYEHAHIGIIKQ